MRAKWLVGMVTIAAALPMGALAESRVTRPDLFVSLGSRGTAVMIEPFDFARSGAIATEATSRALQSVMRAPGMIAAVATATHRVGDTDHADADHADAHHAVSLARFTTGLPATTMTRVPEMGTGFAASALTLLLGAIALLRGGRKHAGLTGA